ncbi:uncharacterized protein LOC108339160 isoform X1 [Vigna angularis]|uniref:uncharacterized protein LOC108339160 isoform X1 n=2 Tax=Phaseolus angularis TaxID=3914 RepID=UPI0022B3DB51|nr:uncharacterized protein LOC108339160 isoform X1 [Vigna angularis]
MFVSFHISNTDSRLLLPTMVDCTCAFYPPATLQVLPLVRAAPANLTFVCSSQRVLPIEELQLSDADDGDPSDAIVDYSDYFNNGDGVVGFDDSLSEEVLKERIRRMRIGLANRGKVPWNKGKKHSAETRERIRQRTIEALRDPKVRKKMAEHPHSHSDQTKAKISDSVRRVWCERLKSKRIREDFLLSWTQSIANFAKKGGIGQEELEWDSYHKIRQQLELHHHMLASKKRREKVMAVTGAKNIILAWRENIARAAKKGGSGEQELDWDSYEKIQEEIIRQRRFQRTEEKAKKKELARVKSEKAARIKAIKRVILTQKRKEHQERAKVKGNTKSHRHRNSKEGKASLEDTQELKLCNPLTKIHMIENTNGDLTREGDTFDCIFPAHNKLDLELIKREKMQKEVSLADQIQAARDKKSTYINKRREFN